MKGRVLIIDAFDGPISQAALVVDGRLEDFIRDAPDDLPGHGAICWARVDRVLPNGGGAFVELTPGHKGFLREAKGVRAGAGVLVQVSGLPDPGKAIPVSRRVLYKSRRVIHTPDAPGINVSRQIRDPEEQERLTKIVEDWSAGEEMGHEPARANYDEMHRSGGYILRSAARNAEASDILADVRTVLGNRSEREGLTRSSAPGSTGATWIAAAEAVRDWTSDVPDMIAINETLDNRLGKDGVAEMLFLDDALLDRISPGDGDPFEHFGVWEEIERLKHPRVELPSGGWMAIESTTAMVTVDVNTGDQFGQGAGMTASVEAARELPRQLRLRGLGGQVIIDFAPIKKMHRKKIEETLKSVFRKDPVPTTLAGWTPLGNFELQRKRERRPLTDVL